MGRSVLITGITSFTGPYVASELASNGYEVFGLCQHPFKLDYATCLNGNIHDSTSLDSALARCKPDFVLHLAAITYIPHGDIAEMYLTNIVGTRNLLAAIARQTHLPEKILLASSANVYGNAVEGALDETTPFAPANDYATSKVAMEYMAETWLNKLPISIVRPFNYTGVGQAEKFIIPKLVSHFRERKPEIELGNINVIRDFSDVRFISESYRHLLDRALAGEIYNLCSGQGYSLSGLIEILSNIAGYQIKVTVNPEFVRENEVKTLIGSNKKLLGLCPALKPIPMQDTLNWMYKSHGTH